MKVPSGFCLLASRDASWSLAAVAICSRPRCAASLARRRVSRRAAPRRGAARRHRRGSPRSPQRPCHVRARRTAGSRATRSFPTRTIGRSSSGASVSRSATATRRAWRTHRRRARGRAVRGRDARLVHRRRRDGDRRRPRRDPARVDGALERPARRICCEDIDDLPPADTPARLVDRAALGGRARDGVWHAGHARWPADDDRRTRPAADRHDARPASRDAPACRRRAAARYWRRGAASGSRVPARGRVASRSWPASDRRTGVALGPVFRGLVSRTSVALALSLPAAALVLAADPHSGRNPGAVAVLVDPLDPRAGQAPTASARRCWHWSSSIGVGTRDDRRDDRLRHGDAARVTARRQMARRIDAPRRRGLRWPRSRPWRVVAIVGLVGAMVIFGSGRAETRELTSADSHRAPHLSPSRRHRRRPTAGRPATPAPDCPATAPPTRTPTPRPTPSRHPRRRLDHAGAKCCPDFSRELRPSRPGHRHRLSPAR